MLLCTPPEAGTVAEFGQGESGMGENARGNRACTPYGDLTAAIAPPPQPDLQATLYLPLHTLYRCVDGSG